MKTRVITVLATTALLSSAFFSLGVWQVERRAWKLDLIERVDQRVRATPTPPPSSWLSARDEYRHVRLSGHYLPVKPALVQASTVLGPGFWVLAPLQTEGGPTVFVNRGFVPTQAEVPSPAGELVVTGLMRASEPGGAFLRHNDPARQRWFSRDVQAIATARGLRSAALYFVDADAAADVAAPADAASTPVGGLTVISFPNNHLQYAITWFVLALMTLGAGRQLWRWERHEATES